MEEEIKKDSLTKRIGRWFREYLMIVKNTIGNIGRDNVSILTSGMVYSTLVAVVPCVTFLSAFLTTLGALQPFTSAISDWLIETFGSETGLYVLNLLSLYSRNAMSLGVVGLVSFIITGLFLINKVYNVINAIFRSHPTSSIFKRYVSFFIFLVTFTVLISFAFALSTTMDGISSLLSGIHAQGLHVHLRKLGSFSSILILFFMMLKFIPAVKIRFDSAFSGALLGTALLFGATFLFTNIIRSTVKYSVIYGAMASLLFVFLYLYIIWYIIIVVAEMTYIYQFKPDTSTLLGRPATAEMQISDTVDIMLEIAKKYAEGKGSTSIYEIARNNAIPISRINFYLNDFLASKLIIPTNSQKTSFVPARPLDQIKASDIIESVYGSGSSDQDSRSVGDNTAREFKLKGIEAFQSITLEELVKIS